MNFKIFVKNLSERVLHIAKHEADKKGYLLKKLAEVNRISILSISCDSVLYIGSLAKTLETGRKTNVFAVKDSGGNYVDFREMNEDVDIQFYSRETLSIQPEEYAATY